MPTAAHVANLPTNTTPFQDRYKKYSESIEFTTRALDSEEALTRKQNLLDNPETVEVWLDNNCPLVLAKVGFVITARVMSLSKKRVEVDISDHEHRIKAHDITMRLHLDNARYPNKGRFCEWVIACTQLTDDGKCVKLVVTKTHAERPWLRSMHEIQQIQDGQDHQTLSLLHNPWRYMPFKDRAGNDIVALVTIRDAQTIHVALVNTNLPPDNHKVQCSEVRFDKLTFGRMFGMVVQMQGHTIHSEPDVDDDITIQMSIMHSKDFSEKFVLNKPFLLPITKFSLLDAANDAVVKQAGECTWTEKPLRIDTMDITNDHTAVMKISRTEWNNPTADASGDWRVATLQLDIPKHVYLAPGIELSITLRAINNYSSDYKQVESSGPPVIELVVEDENINKQIEDKAKASANASTGDDLMDKFRQKGNYARDSAKVDMQISGYISNALSDL